MLSGICSSAVESLPAYGTAGEVNRALASRIRPAWTKKRPVLMELLSPGYKPVQLTSDLASFWSGTYFEVRKELRRRYPKHSWPDTPLEADPVRGLKKK